MGGAILGESPKQQNKYFRILYFFLIW